MSEGLLTGKLLFCSVLYAIFMGFRDCWELQTVCCGILHGSFENLIFKTYCILLHNQSNIINEIIICHKYVTNDQYLKNSLALQEATTVMIILDKRDTNLEMYIVITIYLLLQYIFNGKLIYSILSIEGRVVQFFLLYLGLKLKSKFCLFKQKY